MFDVYGPNYAEYGSLKQIRNNFCLKTILLMASIFCL